MTSEYPKVFYSPVTYAVWKGKTTAAWILEAVFLPYLSYEGCLYKWKPSAFLSLLFPHL